MKFYNKNQGFNSMNFEALKFFEDVNRYIILTFSIDFSFFHKQ